MLKEDRWLRGALLSVLFLVALALFAAPVAAQGGDASPCEDTDGNPTCAEFDDPPVDVTAPPFNPETDWDFWHWVPPEPPPNSGPGEGPAPPEQPQTPPGGCPDPWGCDPNLFHSHDNDDEDESSPDSDCESLWRWEEQAEKEWEDACIQGDPGSQLCTDAINNKFNASFELTHSGCRGI